MAGQPAVKGQPFTFYAYLTSQANTNIFQVNPTLAAGDVLVSVDGGALDPITVLPTVVPAGGPQVQVNLAGAEVGDMTAVWFHDVLGGEWQDVTYIVGTDIQQIGDLAVPGDEMALEDDAITSAKYDETTAFPLEAEDAGATEVARTGADADTLETLSDQIDGVCTLGAGAVEVTYTLLSTVGPFDPIPDADVWVTTDIGGLNVIAGGRTDALGEVVFWLDSGTTVYVWRQKTGWNFTNPDTEDVP